MGKENVRFSKELNEGALEIILDFAHSGVLIINCDRVITNINQWGCDFFGLRREDMLYRDTTEIFPGSELVKVLETREVQKNRVTVRNNKKISITRSPIFKNGRLLGAIAVFNEYNAMNAAEETQIGSLLAEKGLVAKYHFSDIVYRSEALGYSVSLAQSYAKTNSPILITGESGTGKELFAQSIHNASDRKHKPFVALNCATLSESILESELFGYADASFTGAKKGGKVGLFQLANGGTLFLDEIGEIPLSFQAKFLRALQEMQVRPVGSDTIIPVDVRIIAATNKNLMEEVEQGHFRLDLLYRINVLTLPVPPLRERKEDLEDLAWHYFNQKDPAVYQEHSKTIHQVVEGLKAYSFPGNVRELDNMLQRLYLLLTEGLLAQTMPEILAQLVEGMPLVETMEKKKNLSLEEEEREQLIAALVEQKGSRKKTADALGISTATLWRKMKKFHIE